MSFALPVSWGQLSTRQLTIASLLLAALTHQAFRLHESYSPSLWFGLIVAPPAISTAIASHSQSPPTLLLSSVHGFTIHVIVVITSVLVYRASAFHPLARIPGPFVARLSKFYMALLCLGGGQHRYIKELHERYGDVVRIGPNELSIRDPSTVQALLGPSGLQKGPHFIGRLLKADTLTMVALQDTEEHLRRRRAWLRGFSHAALKEYEPFIAHRTAQLRDRLLQVTNETKKGGLVALDQWFNYFSYDFMSDMAFGGGSELLSGEEEDRFWTVMEDSMRNATFLGHVPWLAVLLGHVPAVVAPVKALIMKCEALVRARMARGAARRDLFHYLNHDDSDAPTPPLAQLVDDGILAIVAGADTTASALASIFACILSSPSAYDALQAEVDRFYPKDADVFDITRQREMKYLNAVINEALRLFPPVPGGTQRQTPHNGPGTKIGELYIPPGTSFWVHAYSLQRDARNFSAPGAFRPERWLTPSSQDSSEHVRDGEHSHDERAFMAFSHGPMNCVGKALALLELRTVVVALLQRFRLRVPTALGEEDGVFDLEGYEREYKDFFVSGRSCVEVVLEVRGG